MRVHRVFVAFAGGGAKALIHIGALRALEARNVDFCGVAGTSAGAVVAALKAAGFTSADMVDTGNATTIVERLRLIDPKIRRIADVFGVGGWQRISWLRGTIKHLWHSALLLGAVVALLPFFLGWQVTRIHVALALALLLLLFAGGFWLARIILSGLADLTSFRTAFGVLLQQRLFPGEPERVVVMGDFGTAGRPTLKIVSANLSRGRLHLFSPDRTPGVAVADAVAASVCLPVVFVPQTLDGDLHMDGGIVSNLPAWPFDEERELDPEATTIAVEIASHSERATLSKHRWIRAFVRTALFGSGELNLRVSGEAERLNLESSLDLLDFDLSLDEAIQEVRNAEEAASVRLDKRLFKRPDLYRDACSVVQTLVDEILSALSLASPMATRVAIAIRDRDYRKSLRLRYSVGFDSSTDEGLLLPIDGSICGATWIERASRFEVAPFVEELSMPGLANRRRRNLLPPDRKWVLCVPIFDPLTNEPRIVVQIDGDEQLPMSEGVEAAVTEIETQVTEFFGLIIKELGELEDDDGLEKQ
jgi:NTE family protein